MTADEGSGPEFMEVKGRDLRVGSECPGGDWITEIIPDGEKIWVETDCGNPGYLEPDGIYQIRKYGPGGGV